MKTEEIEMLRELYTKFEMQECYLSIIYTHGIFNIYIKNSLRFGSQF